MSLASYSKNNGIGFLYYVLQQEVWGSFTICSWAVSLKNLMVAQFCQQ
jgi:hypothetical protein